MESRYLEYRIRCICLELENWSREQKNKHHKPSFIGFLYYLCSTYQLKQLSLEWAIVSCVFSAYADVVRAALVRVMVIVVQASNYSIRAQSEWLVNTEADGSY